VKKCVFVPESPKTQRLNDHYASLDQSTYLNAQRVISQAGDGYYVCIVLEREARLEVVRVEVGGWAGEGQTSLHRERLPLVSTGRHPKSRVGASRVMVCRAARASSYRLHKRRIVVFRHRDDQNTLPWRTDAWVVVMKEVRGTGQHESKQQRQTVRKRLD
jgi:hypothetical protein